MFAAEAAAFAARTGCLFVEASAKTAVGVTDEFNEVVTRIINTPALSTKLKGFSTTLTPL